MNFTWRGRPPTVTKRTITMTEEGRFIGTPLGDRTYISLGTEIFGNLLHIYITMN